MRANKQATAAMRRNKRQRVLVLFNEPTLRKDHPNHDAEFEIVEIARLVQAHLHGRGFQADRLGVGEDLRELIQVLRGSSPDVVFNLYEGTGLDSAREIYLAGILEWHGMSYTGCPFATLCMARNKPATKQLLTAAGLPTPYAFVVDSLPLRRLPRRWPVIVKLAEEDASVGMDQGSVVTSRRSLEDRIERLLAEHSSPILVERYIAGRELNMGIVENPQLLVLPPSEVEFHIQDKGYWPIVTYEAKWHEDSRECQMTPVCCPADIPARLARELSELTTRAYRLLGCRDCARVDFRVSRHGKPYILEVNPNPGFHPTAGLAHGLECAGIDYADFVARMVKNAMTRRGTAHARRSRPEKSSCRS